MLMKWTSAGLPCRFNFCSRIRNSSQHNQIGCNKPNRRRKTLAGCSAPLLDQQGLCSWEVVSIISLKL